MAFAVSKSQRFPGCQASSQPHLATIHSGKVFSSDITISSNGENEREKEGPASPGPWCRNDLDASNCGFRSENSGEDVNGDAFRHEELASKLGPAQIAEQTAKLLRTATVGRAAKRSQLNLQGVSRFRGNKGEKEACQEV